MVTAGDTVDTIQVTITAVITAIAMVIMGITTKSAQSCSA